MAAASSGDAPRYRAFISYSHQDEAWGRRLHRRLEGYRLPKRLVGKTAGGRVVPGRLSPIFRDRDELSAAGDLTTEVRAALADSASLIVVCSPAAAASRWVGREIELFRELRPGRPIVAALVHGEPAAAFPAALLEGAERGTFEPIAADFRPGGDGARLALLKLVAGVLGLSLAQLAQRDAQRRLRYVTAVTAASLLAVLAMGLLTVVANDARAEAERQRVEAEGLVGFLLTDLRNRLEGVGRLDVLTTVNARALQYYESQPAESLSVESLEQLARLLHQRGEDAMELGRLDPALRDFVEARRTTAALLAANRDNPDRIWTHAQSEFYVGYVALERDRLPQAAAAFGAYARLAEELVARDADNPKYLREVGYAQGNLCTLALNEPVDAPAALRACSVSLARMQQAAAIGPDPELDADVAHRHGWLADAHRANGDQAAALTHRLAEEKILERLIAADPKNMTLRQSWAALQRALAALEFGAGRKDSAAARLRRARDALDVMITHDPANATWAKRRKQLDADLKLLAERR